MSGAVYSKVIRPSSLTTSLDCSRRWAARHVPDLVGAAGYTLRRGGALHVGAAIGSGVHAGAAYTLAQKIVDGTLGNATEAEDRAEAEFMVRAAEGLNWDATTAGLPAAQQQLRRMTRSHRRYLAPTLQPLVVEQRLECDIGDDWVLSGQGDALAGIPDEDVHDLKTGTQQRANGPQYAAYHVIFQAHGYHPHKIIEDFLPRVRLAIEQPPPVSTTIPVGPALSDCWEAIEGIKTDVAEFERRIVEGGRPPNGAFRPNPQSVLCGERWCNAWGTDFCRSHKGAK